MKLYAKPGVTGICHRGVDYSVKDGAIDYTGPVTPADLSDLAFHGFSGTAPETPVKTDAEVKDEIVTKAKKDFGVNLDRRKSVSALQAEYDALVEAAAKKDEE